MLLGRNVATIPLLMPLRHRSFALLWGGQSLSRIGDSVQFVALPWLVYDLTGSPMAMSSIVVLQRLPLLALLLVGGVAVDRLPRQRVMLASDLLRGLLVGAVALFIAGGQHQLWHLQTMALLFGAAGAFFRPAYSSMAPQLVPREEVVAANSLMSGSRSLAEVGGPLLGALLMAAGGAAVAFLFDAASFGVSALCLLAMPAIPPVSRSVRRPTMVGELAEGFRVVASSAWLRYGILICAAGNAVTGGAYVVVLPQLVRQQLGGGVGSLGTLQGAVAAGALLGIVAVGHYGMRGLRGLWFYGCILVNGFAIAGWGLSLGLPAATLSALLFGMAGGIANVAWDASLQQLVPPKLLGRVISIDMLGSLALGPVGFLVAGALAEAAGPSPLFLLGGLFVVALSLFGLLSPGARRFE